MPRHFGFTALDSVDVISPVVNSEVDRAAIVVRGARQNNLQDIDVAFPRGRLSVVTGVSGSGKSSLALDTVYAEGQRRYVASLSTYAQQFLDRLPRPDVDAIEGLPPAIAIEQKNQILNRRSTVGTATEVYDFLRLLFARVGVAHCPECDVPVRSWTPTAAAESLAGRGQEAGWYVTFALPVSGALTHEVLVDNLRSLGFIRLLAAGQERHLDELDPGEDLTRRTPLFVVVDRVRLGSTAKARITEAIERAYEEGEGEAVLFRRGDAAPGSGVRFSRHRCCPDCGRTLPEPRPNLFSFNSPYGACPECNGFGWLLEYDPARIVPEPGRSLADGALDPWTKPRYGKRRERLRRFVRETGIPWGEPWESLPEKARTVLLRGGRQGGESFEGVLPFLRRLESKKYKAYIRFFLRSYQSYRLCPACDGSRLRAEAAAVRVAGEALPTVAGWTLGALQRWIEGLDPEIGDAAVGAPILRELERRIAILLKVGLDYVTLDRLTRTLSGGEAQRIAIANALGSALTDGLYVLDEPTIGLHARDTRRLLDLLRELGGRGNTVLVVEHDLEVVREADRVFELGPGSGADGGRLVFEGPPEALEKAATATGRWLSSAAEMPPRKRRTLDGPWLGVRRARAHNLREIDVEIPLHAVTAVTGVSGSGKSSLVLDVIHRTLAGATSEESRDDALKGPTCERILNAEWVSEVALVDASPIGKTPRSNPVTYVHAFDPIRRLFAASPGARRRGLDPSHFSFNTAAGRCPVCRGDGHERIEMVFLPDVFVRCEACGGRRYRSEVREVRWRGRSIDEVLEMTADEALSFFAGEPKVGRGLRVLQKIGLGYVALGQPATTLSGGESQRLKLARELARGPRSRRRGGRGILYLLDEPTNGLHNDDIRHLARVLDELVARGHTVIVIEHHLELVARADWIVDLGPEGGPGGGRVVVAGSPEEVAGCEASHTGRALAGRHEREAVPA
ncbi:MAG: excinuclease ABC subunit UvrA [Gemmatimonadota bacterium]